MAIFLGFAPFIVFALLMRFVPTSVSLWGAALTAACLVVREKLRGRSMKILEVGTFVLFALVGFYTSITHIAWDVATVRSVVDGGLFSIITLSLLARRPFTLQYAREQVPAEIQTSPAFVTTNYVITSLWAGAMATIVVADLAMRFFPRIPLWADIVGMMFALGGAFWFTKWYPEQKRRGWRSQKGVSL